MSFVVFESDVGGCAAGAQGVRYVAGKDMGWDGSIAARTDSAPPEPKLLVARCR